MAVDEEDIEDNFTKKEHLLPMNRSIEYPRSFSHRQKSLATVVPNLICHLPDKYPNARQVRIRLVFIHIGKKKLFYLIRCSFLLR